MSLIRLYLPRLPEERNKGRDSTNVAAYQDCRQSNSYIRPFLKPDIYICGASAVKIWPELGRYPSQG